MIVRRAIEALLLAVRQQHEPVGFTVKFAGGRPLGEKCGQPIAALALARATDLIATVPGIHTAALRDGMFTFPVPLPVGEFTIALLWHPRLDGDPANRWLRALVRNACRTHT